MNLNTKKGSYLVVMEWEYMKGSEEKVANIWNQSEAKKLMSSSVLYKAIKKDTFVIIYSVKDFLEIQAFVESNEYKDFVNAIAEYTISDIHQDIHGFVDTVLPRESFVPQTKYMQLRQIEVPLSGIDDYLEWRKRTIFKYVQKNDKVKSFLAFHSVLSSTPGVLFVTEFEGDPDQYRNSFLTPEYQVIIKEAGHDHIKGGLNTFEYELVS
ncbi:hypothetical protein [Clostridium sp.]|uniref:hypothetical protein n=1 Tax=Clostridium sp. TaxID=1506 RepID=UPI00263025F6|nr:hypothetical protein [Clostridium sp.]